MKTVFLISYSLYFLALINPASKVFLLCSLEPRPSRRDLLKLSTQATVVAFIILFVLTGVGNFVLDQIFHVELYSLQLAGGIVLFIIGLSAVRHGRFYEGNVPGTQSDISIVPLGAPLIAGPGTITAAISIAASNGFVPVIVALSAALLVNFVIMIASCGIGDTLNRFHAIGPLVRITGLIVAAVAIQMALDGLSTWIGLLS